MTLQERERERDNDSTTLVVRHRLGRLERVTGESFNNSLTTIKQVFSASVRLLLSSPRLQQLLPYSIFLGLLGHVLIFIDDVLAVSGSKLWI